MAPAKQLTAQDIELMSLMRQSQAGDTQAYAKLLHALSPIIRGFIHNRIGFGNDQDDILQEVLLGIHKASHTYNTERSLLSWVFAIASYKVTDHLRVVYRRQDRETIDSELIETFFNDDVTNATSVNETLQELLRTLPEKQRQIIQLMKLEGYTAKEVAKQLGMTEANVKVIAHRAYKFLIANNESTSL